MVVEDSQIDVDIIINSLGNDYFVIAVDSAEKALEVMNTVNPSLIISDIILPNINGFELLTLIRENPKRNDIPVIFLSSLNSTEDELKGIRSGVTDYIRKPLNKRVFKAKIDNQIEIMEKHRNKLEKEKNISIDNSIDLVIKSISMYYNYKSADTIEHNERTGYNIKILAQELSTKYPFELTSEKIQLLSKAATLHDIGKICISDSILCKEGPLNDDEYEQVKKHSRLGAEIIDKIRELTGESEFLMIANHTILYHHEKCDGSGYPYGLSGNSIPLYGRMMALLDVYDALRSKRPYKKTFSQKKSVDIILNGDNRINPTMFDPDVLEAFKKTYKQFLF